MPASSPILSSSPYIIIRRQMTSAAYTASLNNISSYVLSRITCRINTIAGHLSPPLSEWFYWPCVTTDHAEPALTEKHPTYRPDRFWVPDYVRSSRGSSWTRNYQLQLTAGTTDKMNPHYRTTAKWITCVRESYKITSRVFQWPLPSFSDGTNLLSERPNEPLVERYDHTQSCSHNVNKWRLSSSSFTVTVSFDAKECIQSEKQH
jgi:hypothetical protein